MDLMTKTQIAIFKYVDVPAAEAQSRYVQMNYEEHVAIAKAYDDGMSGIIDHAAAKELVLAVWAKSCERRKADAETKEILPTVAEAATDVESVENTGIEVAKELAAE